MEKEEPAVIFCDESYHTGNNLLDSNQPTFVYSAVHITEEHANRFIKELKDNIPYLKNMKEIKSKIIFREANKNAIIKLFQKLKKI